MARQPFLFALEYPPSRRMVEDLLLVAEQTTTDLIRVTEAVQGEAGFLSLDRLNQVSAEVFADAHVARAVANTVYNVHPDDTDRPVADIRSWLQLNPDQTATVTETKLAAVSERVKLLARPYPALERRRKADRLVQLAGPRCDGADVLCDLRPVFDAKREHVEGLLPLITLRLQVTSPAGDPSVYQVQLTEQTLGQLADKAERAKQKLRVLSVESGRWVADGWLGHDEGGGSEQ